MAQHTYGAVTVTLPNHLTPPANAGKLSPEEVKRIPKAPKGLGLMADIVADTLEKAGSALTVPPDLTPTNLRESGHRAEGQDQVVADLEVAMVTAKQANLLFDAEAYELLRRVHDQVKAQAKQNPQLATQFEALTAYFQKTPRDTKPAG